MAEEEMKYIPYEMALKVVGSVMEEEHIHEPDRRILTVYDSNNRELCWFDAEEIMSEVRSGKKFDGKKKGVESDEMKMAAVELIMHKIPEWAVEHLLDELQNTNK